MSDFGAVKTLAHEAREHMKGFLACKKELEKRGYRVDDFNYEIVIHKTCQEFL